MHQINEAQEAHYIKETRDNINEIRENCTEYVHGKSSRSNVQRIIRNENQVVDYFSSASEVSN